KAPPASRVPSVAAGTAVDTITVPGFAGLTPPPGANRILPPVDWIDPPEAAAQTEAYPILVCAVDADGNEVDGVRLPPIAVPLGTHSGWNVYKAQPGELADRDGSFVPFSRSRAERDAAGDPRPSLEERYGDRAGYAAKVKAVADALVAERLLLP